MTTSESTDHDLIQSYVESGSEAAFAELTRRHLDLVYGVAWRVTGDADAAQDVAQSVFLDLARKASGFSQDIVLPAWLYRAASFAAAKARRREKRRASREIEAMRQHHLNSSAAEDDLLPLLDEALHRLPEADRQAIILRFLSRLDYRSVGRALGVQEDAARKRVDRALEQLRTEFADRGFAASSSSLALALGAVGSQAAPPALATAISSTCLAAVSSGSVGGIFAAALPLKLAVGVASVILGGLVLLQENQLRRLREALAQGETPPLAAPLLSSPTPSLESEAAELARLRLRAESLRQQLTQRSAAVVAVPAPPGPTLLAPGVAVPLTQLEEAGSETPAAALQSSLAAYHRADLERLAELTLAEESERERARSEEPSDERMAAVERLRAEAVEAEQRGDTIELLDVAPDGSDRVRLRARIRRPGQRDELQELMWGRTPLGWRQLPISFANAGN